MRKRAKRGDENPHRPPAFRKTPQNDFAKDHDAISFP